MELLQFESTARKIESRRSFWRWHPIWSLAEHLLARGSATEQNQLCITPEAHSSTHVLGIVVDVLDIGDEIDLVSFKELGPLDDLPADIAQNHYEDHTVCEGTGP